MKKISVFWAMLLISIAVFSQTFEGEINYRNFENHSKTVRKFSKGMAYNGARNVKVLLKGNKMHIFDESMHLNILILPDEDNIVIYNDLLKRGLKCTYSSYKKNYMSAFGPEPTVDGQTKHYNVLPKEEKKTVNGETCTVYSGTVSAQVGSTAPIVTTIEVYSSDKYNVDPVFNCFMNGIETPGIAMKWTTDQHGKVPFLGSMDSFVASEAKTVTPRTVSDEEMRVPSDCQLKETDSPFKMLGIYSDTQKYLKKNKMYPADADSDANVTYSIESEWDF